MIYTPQNVQQKTSPKGTNYIVCDLMDMNGQVTEGVSTFDPIQEGKTVEGSITQNGKYLNFKVQQAIRTGGKTAQMERVMEKKQDAILYSQDRKNDAIAHAGAITNATHQTVAELNAGLLEGTDFRTRLRENIVFYQQLYKNPDSINPAASDNPF